MTPQDVQSRLEQAVRFINAGRTYEAVSILTLLTQAAPRTPDAWRILGHAKRTLRDMPGAETALSQAVVLDKKDVSAQAALGEVQAALGKTREAEKAFRAALALERRNVTAANGLVALLNAAGRHAEALQITTPFAVAAEPDLAMLTAHGITLKALGRLEEAAAAHQRAAELQPTNVVAEHNLAATLADLGRHAEAEAATRRAFDKGGRAPETFLVHAHALQGQDRLDEAEKAYRAALHYRPGYPDAHKDLAQLIWMRTGDAARAVEAMDADIRTQPAVAPTLLLLRAQVLHNAGLDDEAHQTLSGLAQRHPNDAMVRVAASQHAVKAGHRAEALVHAEAAVQQAPGDWRTEITLCEALLALGRGDEAAASAERLRKIDPLNQNGIALQATAWRMIGDPRYGELYDYDALVRSYRIDTPPGWSSLDSYLTSLTEGLHGLHVNYTHPVGQSLRHGSQTNQSLPNSDHPAVRAFTQAVDGPIRAHIAHLGKGKDVVRARNTGDYDIAGIWSVRLRGGGFHIDHMHPRGWLSSACYIALPEAVEGEGRQGWIRFGEPGAPTVPPQLAEHFVKPEPGLLVLFPSYMWHGTVPFTGHDLRLTVAFDVTPKS